MSRLHGISSNPVLRALVRSAHAARARRASRGSSLPQGRPLYRWRFARGRSSRTPRRSRRRICGPPIPTARAEIIEGRFAFAGRALDLRDVSPFHVAPPSDGLAEALLGFGWLRHLRGDGRGGRAAARALVGEFIAQRGASGSAPRRSSR